MLIKSLFILFYLEYLFYLQHISQSIEITYNNKKKISVICTTAYMITLIGHIIKKEENCIHII